MVFSDDPLGPETRAELESRLASLEAERAALLAWLKKAGGILIGCVLVVMAVLSLGFGAEDPALFLGMAAVLGGLFYGGWRMHQLSQRAKSELMECIAGALGFDYRLNATGFPLEHFRRLGLVPRFDRDKLHDHLTAETASGERLELVDAELERKRRTRNRKRNSGPSYVPVFKGLLLRVDAAESFSDQVLVLKDSGLIGNALGGWLRSDEPVHLESARFNGTYTVYANDQVEARRLLTPSVMERCLDLDDQTNGTPQIGFSEGRILIALDRGAPSFEMPQIWKPWDASAFEGMLDDLRYALGAARLLGQELARPQAGEAARAERA